MNTKITSLALVCLFIISSCQVEDDKPIVSTNPVQNKKALESLDHLFQLSLDAKSKSIKGRTTGTMSADEFSATLDSTFSAYVQNSTIKFSVMDEGKLMEYMVKWEEAFQEELSKITEVENDYTPQTKEASLAWMKKFSQNYCLEKLKDDNLALEEKKTIYEQIMLKTIIMTNALDYYVAEDLSGEGERTAGLWSWLKKRAKCVGATLTAVATCGAYIVLLVKSAGTFAIVTATYPQLAGICIGSLANVVRYC